MQTRLDNQHGALPLPGAAIDSWLWHTMLWGRPTRASQPAPLGTGMVGISSFTVELGRPYSAASQSSFFWDSVLAAIASVFLFQRCWVPAVASAVSMLCTSAASGGKSAFQGGAGWFEAGGFKLLPGHPEIPAALMCAEAVLAGGQLSAVYLCPLSGGIASLGLPRSSALSSFFFAAP